VISSGGHRWGSGPIDEEVGGAAPVRRVTIVLIKRLTSQEEGALGPWPAHLWAIPDNAALALHHVKCGASFNLLAFVGADRYLGAQGLTDIELTVPKLHVLTIHV
jgi:hypothetical protein